MYFMIQKAEKLQPDTQWSETVWAHSREEDLMNDQSNPRLCVAALLPFKDGQPDWGSFERMLQWMMKCADHFGVEITFVLNADTGYVFNLSMELYEEVIKRFRSLYPDASFISGVTAVGASSTAFDASCYHSHLEIAQAHGPCEVMIMTSQALNALAPENRRDAYFEIAEKIEVPALVHALEPAFVPWATPFDPWLLHQLAGHEKFVGGKISTLDEPHFLYWASMCRDLGLDFVPHSGDDFGIASAIRMGLPLLIGAGVSACPLICAAKKYWRKDDFDSRIYKLFEAIQSLEDSVFRLDDKGSAAGYKHSTAEILQMLGMIDSAEIHPECPDLRAGNERARMQEALIRPLRVAERMNIPFYSFPS
jgi:dihydrodipicolinate synthase/N-acetylneuraminate lyase